MDASTCPIKHIFLDVVRFTSSRSVEAQAAIVEALNRIVHRVLEDLAVDRKRVILLPTGDGLCIALLNMEDPYDLHVTLALEILRHIGEYNDGQGEPMRRFEVRIGINANTDNIVTDVNGNQNVAGAGINTASRIMNLADEGQVLVGDTVHDVLRVREKYMRFFRSYRGHVKHGVELPVHQLTLSHPGLNTEVPRGFAAKASPAEPRLVRTVGWYIGHAIRFRKLLISMDNEYGSIIWLWYRAKDHVEREERKEHERPDFTTHGFGRLCEEEQVRYYCDVDFEVRADLARYLATGRLEAHRECFQEDQYKIGRDFRYVQEHGRDKLRIEHPDIFDWAMAEGGV